LFQIPFAWCYRRRIPAHRYSRRNQTSLFGERFVFQIGIVTDLRSKTGVVAAHHVNTLVPPVRQVLRFVVFCRARRKDVESATTAPAASNVFFIIMPLFKLSLKALKEVPKRF
jgi:hypothetical protein